MRIIIIGAVAAGTSAAAMCVCEIEVCLNMTQSNASRHLTVLKNCGVLQYYKKAQWAYYGISESFKEEHKEVTFVPIVKILLGVSKVTVPWDTIIVSVVLFVEVPLTAGVLTRGFKGPRAG